MDLERPRFRHDLVARPLEDAGIFYVDVTDPSSGAQFRFYDVEYSIACAMDGDRNLDGLVAWTRAELGVETTKDELKTVVTTLAGLGYLDAPAAVAGAGAVEVVDLTGAPPALTFGDDEQTRPAMREMEAAAALEASDDFSIDEPTRNAAIPTPVDENVDSGLVEMEMSLSAAQRLEEESVTTQIPRGSAAAAAAMGSAPSVAMDVPTGGAANDDLEVDLSAHVELDKHKVKEAVRQSRSVTVPALLDELSGEDAKDDAGAHPIEVRRKESVATKLPTAPPAPAAPAPAAAVAEPPARSSSTFVLVALLLLAVAGGAAYYFLVYKEGPAATQPLPRASTAPEAPPAPLQPTGVVASAEAAAATIAAPGVGSIEWVVPDGQVVAAGDVVAKLAGARRAEATLAQHRDRLTFYQGELSKQNAANNLAGAALTQKKVDEKQALVDTATTALEPLLLKAPTAGPTQALVGAGARVSEGDPIARVAPKDFVFTVEFKDAPIGLAAGAPVKLAVAGQVDRHLAGVVDKVAGAQVLVRLVPPVDVKAGDVVVLLAP